MWLQAEERAEAFAAEKARRTAQEQQLRIAAEEKERVEAEQREQKRLAEVNKPLRNPPSHNFIVVILDPEKV